MFHRLLCLNFGSKSQARHAQRLLLVAHIASDFTCVYCAFLEPQMYMNTVFLIFLSISLGNMTANVIDNVCSYQIGNMKGYNIVNPKLRSALYGQNCFIILQGILRLIVHKSKHSLWHCWLLSRLSTIVTTAKVESIGLRINTNTYRKIFHVKC